MFLRKANEHPKKNAYWPFLTVTVCHFLASSASIAESREQRGMEVSAEVRARYETLSGQFRAGEQGGDQLLALRTLLRAQFNRGPLTFVTELQDSRSYLGDNGTPYSTSLVNPVDVLQAYAQLDIGARLPKQSKTTLKAGRMTFAFGSRRQLDRSDFSNVIFNYTGLHIQSKTKGGAQWHAVYVVPVSRHPIGRESLSQNHMSGDEEAANRRIWGLHYISADNFASIADDVNMELFIYGLNERDTKDNPTPNRHYTTPGVRFIRPPKVSRWDFDVEAAWRFGSRRTTSLPSDTRDQRVRAWTLHAHLGRTFDLKGQPRIALDYDYASGDKSPSDDRFDQYERLFGSRRTDLGNTGIYGPLTPANINAPGFRVEIRPNPRTDARLAYKAAYLASATDSWIVAGVRNPSGASGRFIGHAVDGRIRYWLTPNRLQVEAGLSLLLDGEVGRDMTRNTRREETLYGYTQLTGYF